MKTVSIKFVAKPNGMSTIYLVYSKAITLPDGSSKKSESLKIEIYTIPKNTKEAIIEYQSQANYYFMIF